MKINQPYLCSLYKTLMLTTYFGLFRVGELTGAQGKHAVLAKNVHIAENKRKFSFVLHTSKTHWKNVKPQVINITTTNWGHKNRQTVNSNEKLGTELSCPYESLKHYISLRGPYLNHNEQFFIFADHSPVMAKQLRNCLRRSIINAGFQHHHLYLVHGI